MAMIYNHISISVMKGLILKLEKKRTQQQVLFLHHFLVNQLLSSVGANRKKSERLRPWSMDTVKDSICMFEELTRAMRA